MPFDTNTNPSDSPPPLGREAAPLPAYRAASRPFRVFWAVRNNHSMWTAPAASDEQKAA